jgi:hypothetical protein
MVRTHDPNLRAGEDISSLRPRGHSDRQEQYVINNLFHNQDCRHMGWKDVSKKYTASVLRLKMEAAASSQTLAHTYQITRRPFQDTLILILIAVGAPDHA